MTYLLNYVQPLKASLKVKHELQNKEKQSSRAWPKAVELPLIRRAYSYKFTYFTSVIHDKVVVLLSYIPFGVSTDKMYTPGLAE